MSSPTRSVEITAEEIHNLRDLYKRISDEWWDPSTYAVQNILRRWEDADVQALLREREGRHYD